MIPQRQVVFHGLLPFCVCVYVCVCVCVCKNKLSLDVYIYNIERFHYDVPITSSSNHPRFQRKMTIGDVEIHLERNSIPGPFFLHYKNPKIVISIKLIVAAMQSDIMYQ